VRLDIIQTIKIKSFTIIKKLFITVIKTHKILLLCNYDNGNKRHFSSTRSLFEI
jgi:hypothetical protein